jgi:hypothetical protein
MCSYCLFPVVVTSLKQIVIICYKIDDDNSLATSCSNKTVRNKLLYELVVINLLTTCYVQTISDLLEQLVASLLASSTLLQDDITTCSRLVNNWGTSSANISFGQGCEIFYPCRFLLWAGYVFYIVWHGLFSTSIEDTDEQRKLYIKDTILSQGRKISAAKKLEIS